jgi:hypothetical protein
MIDVADVEHKEGAVRSTAKSVLNRSIVRNVIMITINRTWIFVRRVIRAPIDRIVQLRIPIR